MREIVLLCVVFISALSADQRTFVTWDGDPATEATIQTLATNAETVYSQVLYRGAEDSDWEQLDLAKVKFGDTHLLLQAALENLMPGQVYEFSFDGAGTVFKFKTAPTKLPAETRFVIGGDVGTGGKVAPLFRHSAAYHPAFAVIGGDIAYANGEKTERWDKFLTLWSKHMRNPEGELIPMVACIGNHEVKGGFNRTREEALFFYAIFGRAFPERGYKTFHFGDDLLLLLLDSGHVEQVEGDQTDWLNEMLNENQGVTFKFPVYHVPAYPGYRPFSNVKRNNSRGGYPQRKYWLPLFEEYGIRLAFEHDDHLYKRTYPMFQEKINEKVGIIFVGDGAWGQKRSLPENDIERPYLHKHLAESHFIVVDLKRSDAGIRCRAFNENNDLIDSFTINQ